MIAKRDEAVDNLADLVLDGGYFEANEHSDPATLRNAVRALAFTVWAFEVGRDLVLTQRIVEERSGMRVSLDDLRLWRRTDSWAENSRSVHQTLGSESRLIVNQMGSLGNIKAARTLLHVMDHGERDGDRVKAAQTWLDRFGHPVMIRGELFNGLDIGVSDVDDSELESQWMDYTPDPLAERHGDTSRIQQIQDTQLYQHANLT